MHFLNGISKLLHSLRNMTGMTIFSDLGSQLDRQINRKANFEGTMAQHKSNVADVAKSAKEVGKKSA